MLLIFECVHTCPEAIVGVADQLLLGHQPLERLNDELFLITDIIKDFLLKNEKPSIDPQVAVIQGVNSGNKIAIALLQRDHVVAEVGPDAEEARNLILFVKVVKLFGKGHVGQAIAVVREEFFFPFKMLLNRLQALTNVGTDSGVRECDSPILDITV